MTAHETGLGNKNKRIKSSRNGRVQYFTAVIEISHFEFPLLNLLFSFKSLAEDSGGFTAVPVRGRVVNKFNNFILKLEVKLM